jgi:hypothetical protein
VATTEPVGWWLNMPLLDLKTFFSVISPELTNNLSSLDIFLPSVSSYLIITKGRRYLELEESWAMMMILFYNFRGK